MKGLIGTADFLRAVLNKEWGLRTGKILSHVAVFDSVKLDRLILMTDAAMVMYPTLEEKIAMINNTIPVCQALEIEDPKAAAVCAVEVLNPSMQPTLDAASLDIMSQRGQFKGITVDGPLALDNALNEDAARHQRHQEPGCRPCRCTAYAKYRVRKHYVEDSGIHGKMRNRRRTDGSCSTGCHYFPF